MPDLDPPYASNGTGAEHRPELRSAMPFFPAPTGAPASPASSGATGTVPPLRGEVMAPLTGADPVGQPLSSLSSTAPPLPSTPSAPPMPSLSSMPSMPSAPSMSSVSSLPPVSPVPPVSPLPSPVAESGPIETPAGRAAVKGQIRIEDEVVEKIAALAALEVSGVAALGGRRESSETMDAVRQRIGGDRGEPGVRALVADDQISLDVSLVVEYGSVVIDVAKVVKTNVARTVGLMLGMRVSSVNVTVEDVRMPGAAS